MSVFGLAMFALVAYAAGFTTNALRVGRRQRELDQMSAALDQQAELLDARRAAIKDVDVAVIDRADSGLPVGILASVATLTEADAKAIKARWLETAGSDLPARGAGLGRAELGQVVIPVGSTRYVARLAVPHLMPPAPLGWLERIGLRLSLTMTHAGWLIEAGVRRVAGWWGAGRTAVRVRAERRRQARHKVSATDLTTRLRAERESAGRMLVNGPRHGSGAHSGSVAQRRRSRAAEQWAEARRMSRTLSAPEHNDGWEAAS